MADAAVKQDLARFYREEARDRDTEAWLREGGSARVPESKAARYFIDRKVRQALALAPLPRSARLLEVGCSFGHMTFLLAQRVERLTAVDLSPDSLELAKRRAQRYGVTNIGWQVADAEALPLVDHSFDAVYSFSTLRFCPNAERAVAEMARVVRPGGSVVVDFPNRYCPWFGLLKSLLGLHPHIHDRLYASSEATALLEGAGLGQLAVQQFLLASKRLPAWSLPPVKLLERLVEPVPLLRQLTAIIMVRGVKDDEGAR